MIPDSSLTTTTERLLPAVRQVMAVAECMEGAAAMGYAARFRGALTVASEGAYTRLDPVFEQQGMSLFFRKEGDLDVILAVAGRLQPRPSNPWILGGLLGLTILSVLFAGILYGYEGPPRLGEMLRAWPVGVPFAASLITILGAHELGHYFAARWHRTPVSLPYFLPFPGSPFGTLGAFIQLKQSPRDRNALLDIAMAGPLAGLLPAIPLLIYGLSHSTIGPLPMDPHQLGGLEGNSIVYLGLKWIVTGQLLPAPASYAGVPPFLYWVRYLFTGTPLPLGGTDVYLHPVAWAGWAGLLVTALNLIPAGQLDGGHVMYVVLGERARRLWPFLLGGLLLLGLVWPGWLLWAGLIFVFGRTYARPLDEITPLDPRRKAVAILGLILFFLLFIPLPLLSLT
jgi:Zn-dependent protease